VHVGVGHDDAQLIDMNDEHVRGRLADVVFDDERRSAARRHRTETGMAELEGLGLVDAAHERADERTIARREPVGLRALDLVRRERRLEPVDGLVQVDDEQVRAVRPLAFR